MKPARHMGLALLILFGLALSSTGPSRFAGALTTADISLSPSQLRFSCSFHPDRGCQCTAGQATLTNSGDTPLTIRSISPGPGGTCGSDSVWGETNDCPRHLRAGESCTIDVRLKPAVYHSQGELLVYILGMSSPLKVTLSGIAQCSPCER
jgi:hypothetical protein